MVELFFAGIWLQISDSAFLFCWGISVISDSYHSEIQHSGDAGVQGLAPWVKGYRFIFLLAAANGWHPRMKMTRDVLIQEISILCWWVYFFSPYIFHRQLRSQLMRLSRLLNSTSQSGGSWKNKQLHQDHTTVEPRATDLNLGLLDSLCIHLCSSERRQRSAYLNEVQALWDPRMHSPFVSQSYLLFTLYIQT